jgi:phytanoyl-CoA dioxygenase PhyH
MAYMEAPVREEEGAVRSSALRRFLIAVRRQGAKLSLYVFNNRLPPWQNALHTFYHSLCVTKRFLLGPSAPLKKAPPDVRAEVASLRVHGYVHLAAQLTGSPLERIQRWVREAFADPRRVWAPSIVQDKIALLKFGLNEIPDLLEFFTPRVMAIAEHYSRAPIKFFGVEIYRLIPSQSAPKISWLWHYDSHPREIFKVWGFLTDTDAETGALRMHSLRDSRALFARGFRDRDFTDAFQSELNDPRRYQVMTGRAGDVLLFTNNAIHKATPPERGYRDVVVFKCLPSLVSFKDHFSRNVDKLTDRGSDYPVNPFGV